MFLFYINIYPGEKMNKENLVESHSGLIYKIASYYKEQALVEDLYQVGVIGLLKAYENYREGMNAKFSTYAFDYIRGEMLSYLKKDNLIKVSKEYFKLRKNYEMAREMMCVRMGRVPSKSEVCLYLEIDEKLMDDVLCSTESVLSLDYENEECDLYSRLGECYQEQIDNKILVESLLESLDEEERKILEYRYLYDYTQDKTADLLGMSQIGVCRKEKKTILKLRQKVS